MSSVGQEDAGVEELVIGVRAMELEETLLPDADLGIAIDEIGVIDPWNPDNSAAVWTIIAIRTQGPRHRYYRRFGERNEIGSTLGLR